MEYDIGKKPEKCLPPNYKREWAEVETEHDIYYAYINTENQVEIRSAKTLARCMILGEGKARSNYASLTLECVEKEIFLLYTCYEAMQNVYLLGAVYPFPGKREEVIYTGSRKRICYGTFWLEDEFYLAMKLENESVKIMKKGCGRFEEV